MFLREPSRFQLQKKAVCALFRRGLRFLLSAVHELVEAAPRGGLAIALDEFTAGHGTDGGGVGERANGAVSLAAVAAVARLLEVEGGVSCGAVP